MLWECITRQDVIPSLAAQAGGARNLSSMEAPPRAAPRTPLTFGGRLDQDFHFGAIGKVDVFERIEDAAAKTRANFDRRIDRRN